MRFWCNGTEVVYEGDLSRTLLSWLRNDAGLTSAKDGCSGQAACGACMVEIDGKPVLSCVTRLEKLEGAHVTTIEGWPESVRRTLGRAFVDAGAVQCGFCTPGFLARTKILLQNNPRPTRDEIIEALSKNVCRCTGYVKIIEAVEMAARALAAGREIELYEPGKVGTRQPKYDAYYKAIGKSPFVDDLRLEGMLFGALRMSDHPRARVLSINTSRAESMPGVLRVVTARDVPGQRHVGLVEQDWPVYIAVGEITRYIGDVLACVVAGTEEQARAAAAVIDIEYEVLPPLVAMTEAEVSQIRVHPDRPNLAGHCAIVRGGNAQAALESSAFVSRGVYETQRIEHAFLETECAIGEPWDEGGIRVFSQSQGVYEDRKQIAALLGLPESRVDIALVPAGGGFGGKEDLTVQGHAALAAWLLQRPVKVRLTRPESITMHPKRHPFRMEYEVGCDHKGMLTVVRARMLADTGAYLSVGTKVVERAVGHATGAYNVPCVDLEGKAVYTNNIPCGAMRGFGVNQAVFAIENCISDLCMQGGFDRWQFRYDNALVEGSVTATGQVLHNVAVRETLQSVKDEFYRNRYTGLACSIKNCGVGNGMKDESLVKVEFLAPDHIVLHHGWTEMGQGVDTVALQMLCDKTGIKPEYVEVRVETRFEARAGMTTSSRGTSLVGNSILNAVEKILKDLEGGKTPADLVGRIYEGYWCCDWTTKPGSDGPQCTHYSYSYATQLVILDDTTGRISKVIAAHDAGRIVNPTMFEGQVQGAVHMGIGYAITEDLPMVDGRLKSTRFRDLGILGIKDTPEIMVKGVEVHDPHGPYGAKGIGEIGLVATAGAISNAYYQYDGIRRYRLPMLPPDQDKHQECLRKRAE